ncbi:MAG TPA: S8 family serine peptidase, partial [Gaiellaceae bacterium]|nr:S8 family serine peptidase [Gaiellaceae bacterium]
MTARRHLHLHLLATALLCCAVAGAIMLVGSGRHTPPSSSLPSWPQSDLLVRTPHAGVTKTASITVRFRSGLSRAKRKQLLAGYGAVETGAVPVLGLQVVAVVPSKAKKLLAHLRASNAVASASPDQVRGVAATTTNSAVESQWAMQRIGWQSAYSHVTVKRSVRVAVLDTGVDANVPDLHSRLVGGYSAFAGSTPTTDPNGHGTWMTSVALAVDPRAKVMPVQVLDAHGLGTDSDIIKGLVWAANHHANVILMSFDGAGYSPDLQRAIDYAWSKGAVVVAATGNEGSSVATYPAGDARVVGVSATDALDHLWAGSNYGTDTFMAAPGVDIVAEQPGGGATTVTGTSASAAFVAGSAALLLGVDRKATNASVIGRLAASAHRVSTRVQTGNGRLDLARALATKKSSAVVPKGVAGRQSGGPFVGPYEAAAAATGLTIVGSGTSAAASTQLVVTLTAPVAVGSTLFVLAGQNYNSGTGITVTDNLGTPNTYTQDVSLNNSSLHTTLFHATVTHALAVGNTVTITYPNGSG